MKTFTVSPITTHVLAEIAKLYQVASAVRGSPPEPRRAKRQAESSVIVTELHAWLTEQIKTLPRKSLTMEAITYAFNQWSALSRYLDDGRIEIDNNAAERSVRGRVAVPVFRVAAFTDDCRSSDELQLGIGHRQCAQAKPSKAMTAFRQNQIQRLSGSF